MLRFLPKITLSTVFLIFLLPLHETEAVNINDIHFLNEPNCTRPKTHTINPNNHPTIPVRLEIIQFNQFDDPDGGSLSLHDPIGDYYAEVTIGDNATQSSSRIDGPKFGTGYLGGGEYAITPNDWVFTENIERNLETIRITIKILDYDGDVRDKVPIFGWFTKKLLEDDQMDINPLPNQQTLVLQREFAILPNSRI